MRDEEVDDGDRVVGLGKWKKECRPLVRRKAGTHEVLGNVALVRLQVVSFQHRHLRRMAFRRSLGSE